MQAVQPNNRTRYPLRRDRSPLAVHHRSRSRFHHFFLWLGKLTFIAVVALSVSMTILWARRRPGLFGFHLPAIEAASTESDYTVEATPPIASPEIMNVAFWGITGSGVTIAWATNVPATTAVSYGTSSASLGQTTPVKTNLTNNHGVSLSGLSGGTTYYFVAQSGDANGNVGRSKVYTFRTTDTAPPKISGIAVAPGKNNQAKIEWTTSVPAISYVQFGLTSAYGKWSTTTELTSKPKPTMGWVPQGVVHFHLVSKDSVGNVAISPDYTFVEP
jgi:hypothetical protein